MVLVLHELYLFLNSERCEIPFKEKVQYNKRYTYT